MDRQCFNEIVALLTPHMTTTSVRQEILTAAWYGTPLEYAIQWEGNPRTFTVNAVKRADDYGQIDPSIPALVALLEGLRGQVGYDKQQTIDDILARCFANASPALDKAVADVPDLPMPKNSAEKKHIFISYSSGDRVGFVDRLAKELTEVRYTVWVDNLGPKYYGITAGKAWKQELADALNQAQAVVFVITPESLKSAWCQAELKRATEQNIPVIPVLARPISDEDRKIMSDIQQGSETLADTQYRDFVGLGWDRGFEVMLNDIRRHTN